MYLAYLDATQRPNGYVNLDLTQDKNDDLRFRTNVFPKECPPVVLSDIDDEACEIDYHASTCSRQPN